MRLKIQTDEKKYLWMAWFLPIFMLADIGLTLVNVHDYLEVNPDQTYEDIEMNPVITYAWNNWGFYRGTVILFSIYFPFIIFLARKFYKQELPLVFCGFIWGTYIMVLYTHLHWLLYLKWGIT